MTKAMDTNAATMSIIARCLTNPGFLAEVQQDKEATLLEYGLKSEVFKEFQTLDLDKVALFSGFITRVKHNFLWDSIPRTLRLLKLHGCELRVFAMYATLFNEGAKPSSREERIRRFCCFLQGLFSSDDQLRCLLYAREVFAHEHIVWQLRTAPGARPVVAVHYTNHTRLTFKSSRLIIPAIRGRIRIMGFAVDPRIEIRDAEPANIAGEDNQIALWLVYWRPPSDSELRLVELPAPVATILRLIDSRLSVAELLRLLNSSFPEIKSEVAYRLLDQLDNLGIIELQYDQTYKTY